MQSAQLVLALLIAVAALVTIARRLGIAYPIFLVIGGLLLGLVPGTPRVEIDPDLIFLFVLPPLLYTAAFFTPLRSLRANLGAIGSLAVGLVVATAFAAAAGGARPDPRHPVGGRPRSRRDRRAARRDRGHRDRGPPGRAATDRDDPRGRKPLERRDRADDLQHRDRGRPRGRVQGIHWRRDLRGRHAGQRGDRPGGGLDRRAAPRAHRGHPGGAHDLAAG